MSATVTPPTSPGAPLPAKNRKLKYLANLSRSPTVGRWATTNIIRSQQCRRPEIHAYSPQHWWPWITSYCRYVFTPKHPAPQYGNPNEGVYPIAPRCSIALAGDWGSGTDEAALVGQCINRHRPDVSIHLGDVYFVGGAREIAEHMLANHHAILSGTEWPSGRLGRFALLGNHEMYAKGWAYFTALLPQMGMDGRPQTNSYFALDTGSWLIIALDTGYNSLGLPILGAIPGIRSLPWVRANCRLSDTQLRWVSAIVRDRPEHRIMLLSHHQYVSAFGDESFSLPARQLSPILRGRKVVWYWGHEHRVAIYQDISPTSNVNFTIRGRCVGHGGMPVERVHPSSSTVKWWDQRTYQPQVPVNMVLGYNGYALLSFDGQTAVAHYHDLYGKLLKSDPLD